MSDLITLSCPNCAGKLRVSPESASLVCPSCGNEYLVRREAGSVLLEGHARCPRCGRNDQVKAASAVVREQTMALNGVLLNGGAGVFAGTQQSALAGALAAPVEPAPEANGSTQGCSGVAFGLAGLLAAMGLCSLLGNSEGASGNPIAVFLLIVAAGLVLAAFRSRAAAGERQQRSQAAHSAWERAIARWQRLYYCARDDCAFIPGENQAVPLAQVNDYLYR
jgi:predicted RNA-binding Zn-ribbon protein involved in translation (DUF1610 family)